MQDIYHWVTANLLELAGFIAALIYLRFSIRQNKLLWPWGIATSAVYMYLFFQSKVYGYAALNLYYVVISIYGWFHWKNKEQNADDHESIKPAHLTKGWAVIGISIFLWGVLYLILVRFTDSQIPVGDAFTTAFSITATWLLARKIIENWIFWILIDTVAAGLYLHQNLYLTAILYVIYTIMAIIGYRAWKKSL